MQGTNKKKLDMILNFIIQPQKDFMSKGDNTGVNTSKCKSTQFSMDVTVAMLVLGLPYKNSF